MFQCSLKGGGVVQVFKPLVSAPGATKTKVIRVIFFFLLSFSFRTYFPLLALPTFYKK